MAHLATCRGTATVTTTTVDNNNASRSAVEKTGDQETAQQHPMENKIFVWNPALVSTSVDEVTVTPAAEVPKVKASPPAIKQEQKTDDDNGADDEEKRPHDVKVRRVTESAPQQKQQSIRKDGKMYKTVSPALALFDGSTSIITIFVYHSLIKFVTFSSPPRPFDENVFFVYRFAPVQYLFRV